MGNCLNPSSKIQIAQSSNQASDESKFESKSSLSSIPSSQTFSNPSTFTGPSYTESRNLDVPPMPKTEGEILSSSNVKAFTYSELRSATDNFTRDNLLGEGGFGHVYKGWLDECTLDPSVPGSGMMVAIKKLKPEGFQGHKEWLTEVEYLGQLLHPNLVKLIGYCLDGDNRLLVYDYMPNGSLDYHLFGRTSKPLPWTTRINVAVGAARGFTYLHDGESQIIFRDVKASNILLDKDFNAKLSDFGLAKDGPYGNNTHVSTRVMGTQGYAAPEYVTRGRLTAKADVYSFGVVVLELLSGRRALDKNRIRTERYLVDWATPFLGDRRMLYKIMDTRLEGQYSKKSAHIIAKLALECINTEARLRPNMSDVLAALEPFQGQTFVADASDSSFEKSPMRHVVKTKDV